MIPVPKSYRNTSRFLVSILLVVVMAGIPCAVRSQVYNFSHYDIDDGLVQSQVQKISQDQLHYIWFASLGGLSRFDGKEFKSFTKSDGLSTSNVTAVLRDSKGRTWIGSEDGIACMNQDKITAVPGPATMGSTLVKSIIEDRFKRIWFTKGSRLFFLDKQKIIASRIASSEEFVTTLTTNTQGKPYAAIYGKGIFSYNGKTWTREVQLKDSLVVNRILFDRTHPDIVYLLTPKQVWIAGPQGVKAVQHPLLSQVESPLTSLAQDADGYLWVGNNNGAYWLSPGAGVHFTAANGFSNNRVNDIFRDAEGNIWLAADGAGVYKFDGGAFVSFRPTSFSSRTLMGMARDSVGNLWIGSQGQGVIKYDGKSFNILAIPSPAPFSRIVQNVHVTGNSLYAGTLNGLWKLNGRSFTNILEQAPYPKSINALFTDRSGTLWIGASKGCFYLEKGRPKLIPGITHTVNCLVEVGKDSVLAGTSQGVYLVVHKVADAHFRLPGLENSQILALLNYKGCILAGTFGDGVFTVDVKKRSTRQFNTKQGLYSNDIYTLAADSNGYVWAGTGRGVNRFAVNVPEFSLTMQNGALPYVLLECNSNSLLQLNGKMWVATTKGLYAFATVPKALPGKKPFMIISSVRVIDQAADTKGLQQVKVYQDKIPPVLTLNYRQNRILISFIGIYLTDPDRVLYQYRLRGLGETFSQPAKTNLIEFPALLPGTYTFEVKAVAGNGRVSETSTITLIIEPPFYQTLLFRLLVVLFLVAFIIAVQYYYTYTKARQKRILGEIKLAEQNKIRRQTAEDFHDDIGNKLTRIAVLSDLLNKYIPEEQTEQKNLVKQIKSNAATLYSGTKDILWALDPQSDNLREILNYVNNLGNELFEPGKIRFSFVQDELVSDKKLPMKYSRNISMILKEVFHNILKHAGAKQVEVTATSADQGVTILVRDNGKGFNNGLETKGRGLKNMQVRAERINGQLRVISAENEGTTISLSVPLDGNYKDMIGD